MYKIMCFIKSCQTPFGASFKDEETAKSASANIHELRKGYLESGKDCIIKLVGDDYGALEILASDIVVSMLMFAPDGIQLMSGQIGRA